MNAAQASLVFIIQLCLSIGIIVTSVYFRHESYELISEYANVSEIWRGNRIGYCGTYPPITAENKWNSRRWNGPEECYQTQAEDQASLLDYHPLLRVSSHYFKQYKDTYNFNVSGKGEKYIEVREVGLRGYPGSWITLTIFATCISILNILATLGLCLVQLFRKADTEKVGIGIFFFAFLLLLALFITAIVNKANYGCPGLQYESKYGSFSDCDHTTHGEYLCGFLGGNMVFTFLVSTCLIYSRFKKEEARKTENELIRR